MKRTLLATIAAVVMLGSCPAMADQTHVIIVQRAPTYYGTPGGKLIINQPGLGQTWADVEQIEADKAAARAEFCRTNRCAKEVPLR